MRIQLSEIPIFCLTCESEGGSKREHITTEWSRENVAGSFVYPMMGIAKNKSGASGFFRMIERGLQSQIPGQSFRPFLMIEDDISFLDYETAKKIEIPDDADILYAGLSNCSMNSYCFHYANYYEPVEGFPEIVRVKHMLATHGILVCSALGAAAIQRTMLEVFLSDKPWDIPLAFLQPYYRVYALRQPWVYQDAAYGGAEACTNISFEGDGRPLPDEWVTKDWITLKLL